ACFQREAADEPDACRFHYLVLTARRSCWRIACNHFPVACTGSVRRGIWSGKLCARSFYPRDGLCNRRTRARFYLWLWRAGLVWTCRLFSPWGLLPPDFSRPPHFTPPSFPFLTPPSL